MSNAPTLPVARILVVEDDAGVRSVLQNALSDEGYVVATAPDGVAALELLSRPPDAGGFAPHLIVLDIKMPAMDGIGFAQAYRQRPGRHAPIVVVTASIGLAKAAEEVVPLDVIQKPFELADLLDRIAAALRLA